jgi:poly-gamma-glutamate synthase PgsB/CapB
MAGEVFLAVIAVVLAAAGVLEFLAHKRKLDAIPVRIHVNGTRGKSSVTRLIAAGLREGGITTCAKTTGTLARMIMPDGTEYPVFRPAGPNIIEQLRIVRTAAAYEPQVLVIECMAVQPTLQALCELKLIRATHGVITNARADHLEVMGPSEEDVALALAGTTPLHGKLFTADHRHLDVFAKAAQDRTRSLRLLVRRTRGERGAGASRMRRAGRRQEHGAGRHVESAA